jgi:hypothetical protein
VRLGRHTWRARVLPRWTGVALALTVPVGIVLAEVGGCAVLGLLWIYLGARLLEPARQTRSSSVPA